MGAYGIDVGEIDFAEPNVWRSQTPKIGRLDFWGVNFFFLELICLNLTVGESTSFS